MRKSKANRAFVTSLSLNYRNFKAFKSDFRQKYQEKDMQNMSFLSFKLQNAVYSALFLPIRRILNSLISFAYLLVKIAPTIVIPRPIPMLMPVRKFLR